MCLDALRVIGRIKKKPSQASKIKLDHYKNVGVIEVFLEAVPTAFILIVISYVGIYDGGNRSTDGLGYSLIGSGYVNNYSFDYWSLTLFFISCATSIFSAVFGMSRYLIEINIRKLKSNFR